MTLITSGLLNLGLTCELISTCILSPNKLVIEDNFYQMHVLSFDKKTDK